MGIVKHLTELLLGTANGVATLDGGGKIPVSQLPTAVQGGITVIAFWDASTNTPDLTVATPNQGEAYQVSVAGSTNINGETNWAVKDLVVWDDNLAGNWFKIDNTDAVASVNSQTGTVVLDADDIDDSATSHKFVTSGDVTNLGNLSGTNSGDQPVASQGEVNTGTDTTKIVTPDTLEDKTYGTFTGTTITDNATLKTALQELETKAEAGGVATPGDMAALVVERTTDLLITGTSTGTANAVTFDTTATENMPSELEHNNTNTERLEIKTSGLHQIMFSINVENSSAQQETLELELRVDDSVVKTIMFEISKSSEELVTRATAVELTAGTYLSFKLWQSSGSSDLTLVANTIGYVLKLQGQKGDKGDPGTISDWEAPNINLGDGFGGGATLAPSVSGAGVYLNFANNANNGYYINTVLENNGVPYDGSDIEIWIVWYTQTGWTMLNREVSFDTRHILYEEGDSTTTTETTINTQIDMTGRSGDVYYKTKIATISGAAATKTNLDLLFVRLGSADDFDGPFRIFDFLTRAV